MTHAMLPPLPGLPPRPKPQGDDLPLPDLPDFLPWMPMRRSPRAGARGWTPEVQRAFLNHLLHRPSVRHAAQAVGMSARTAYALRDRPGAESFAVTWDWALREGRGRVVQAVIGRCFEGERQPVFRRGRQCGERIVYNDRLAIAVLERGDRDTGLAEALDAERERLRRWEISIRRRELDLDDPAYRERLRNAETHEMWRRELDAADRRDRQAGVRAKVRAVRAAACEAAKRQPRTLRIRSI
jgi:hypothetical protein